MVILVCGGRDYTDQAKVFSALDAIWEKQIITHIVCGDAPGADALAIAWCREHGVPYHAYPAAWKQVGRSAGPMRNRQMLMSEDVDLVLTFPGGPGTANMTRIAREQGIRTEVIL